MSNDNWKDTQQAAINMTGLAPPNDLGSAEPLPWFTNRTTGYSIDRNRAASSGFAQES
jgi:hypothetical protein